MRSADVVVIGGGVMGCSIAYHLAKQKVQVLLLEREPRLASGSTGRCSGGIRHQFSNPLNVQLSIASILKMKAFADELDCEIDLHQDGYLFLIRKNRYGTSGRARRSKTRWACPLKYCQPQRLPG